MKSRALLCVIYLLCLQACQHKTAPDEDVRVQTTHLSEAAGFNVQLGLGYLKQGNIPRAKRKLLRALEQAPKSPDANAAMAYFMEKAGDMDNAKTYYHNALAYAPGRGTQLNNYGAFQCRQGHYEEAERYFLQAVADLQYEHTAGAYENAGLCAMEVPDLPKAERFFLKALEQDPSSKQSLYELVHIEIKQKRFDDALRTLKQYPEVVLHSEDLLSFAILAANQTGKSDLLANYRRSLDDISGVKQHDNSNNG